LDGGWWIGGVEWSGVEGLKLVRENVHPFIPSSLGLEEERRRGEVLLIPQVIKRWDLTVTNKKPLVIVYDIRIYGTLLLPPSLSLPLSQEPSN
jgi:hypothetical protein